ncbi:proteasome assembly chaperone family protein [Haloarcula amylolytica]|uniref:proteasome assembly chaperone family protein n=1 Tax=Haloarcula amylolytica TaxID=396317 RepID=UPI003C725BF6
MAPNSSTSFERMTELRAESPTLIEGLPGLGLVASIAVDQITKQLDLEQHGTIVSDDFPPVAAFNDGRVRDAVRVYGGEDPAVMTLQSDVPIPPTAVESLSQCVLSDVAEEFERAVFLAGTPAETEDDIGEVMGVATTDQLEGALTDAEITLADGAGVLGGVTGALLNACYHDDVPAAVLIVRSHPYIPDPGAARAVIENALEPLVKFDIDTQELLEQAEEIQQQKQQIAEQLQQYQQQQDQPPAGMYQ